MRYCMTYFRGEGWPERQRNLSQESSEYEVQEQQLQCEVRWFYLCLNFGREFLQSLLIHVEVVSNSGQWILSSATSFIHYSYNCHTIIHLMSYVVGTASLNNSGITELLAQPTELRRLVGSTTALCLKVPKLRFRSGDGVLVTRFSWISSALTSYCRDSASN
jgi:hypothetical protein